MKKISKADIILLVFSLVLGIFISTQVKQKTDKYNPFTLRTLQIKKNEVNKINNEIEEMDELLEKKEEELTKFKDLKQKDEDIYSVLEEELDIVKAVSGFKEMEGPGVIIKMGDNQDSEIIGSDVDDDVIHDIDILIILNDLKSAGAEAISINGERIVSISEIKCGGPIIKVNGKSIGSPFIIKAIGDSKLLYAAVTAPGTYGYIRKNVYKVELEASMEDKVVVPAYSGGFNFKYAKPIKEGD